MALVPYKVVALAESDAQGTDGKNIVSDANISLYDELNNPATLYDDSNYTNGATFKTTDSNGVVVFYVEEGEYEEQVNSSPRRKVLAGSKSNNVVSYATTAELQATRPVKTGQRAENRERANAQYVLAAAGYVAQAGDITAANGRVWELQVDGNANVKWFGAKGDGVTDDSQAIKDALSFCKENGKIFTGVGVYKATSKIVASCQIYCPAMEIHFEGIGLGVAFELSTGSAENPTDILLLDKSFYFSLPAIINLDKPPVGWAGQGVGLRYVNVQNAKIIENKVDGFKTGVLHTSYSNGCGYCTVEAGFLRNNEINRRFSVGDSSGFTNRWDLYGGRYFHFSSEGVEVSNIYHVKVDAGAASIINDINFFGASLEGTAEEYHAVVGGAYVNFIGCRWESSAPGGNKVIFEGTVPGEGSSNMIIGGRGADEINITYTGTAGGNYLQTRDGFGISSSVSSYLKNKSSSAGSSLAIYEATISEESANPDTDYSLRLSAQSLRGKRSGDSSPRVELDCRNGRIKLGNGLSQNAGITGLGSEGTGILGNFYISEVDNAPGNIYGYTAMYLDPSDGELKIRLSNGVIKTVTTT